MLKKRMMATLLAAGVLIGTAATGAVPVLAEDETTGGTTQTTTVTVTTTPGELVLEEVPNFIAKGNVNLGALAKNNQTYEFDAPAGKNRVKISNARGEKVDWKLTATISETLVNQTVIGTTEFENFTLTGVSSDNGTTVNDSLAIGEGPSELLKEAEIGNTELTVTGAKLTLLKNDKVPSGNYTTAITWTLENGPGAGSAD